MKMHYRFALILSLFILILANQRQASAQTVDYAIEYDIDRSALPALPNNELTLNIAVGDVIDFRLEDENGMTLDGDLDEENGVITVTTAAESILLTLATNTDNPLIGSFSVSTLKHNKQWAWSHGLDDNNDLSETISYFERRDWEGTLFLIGRQVETSFEFTDGMSQARAVELLNAGWSLGNHSYAHEDCDPLEDRTEEEEILEGQVVLDAIVAASERPAYQPISMAAPCFLPGYQPALETLQDRDATNIIYNESEDRYVLRLDPNITEVETLPNGTIYPFSLENPIGRDGYVDAFDDINTVIQTVDWVARQSDSGKHLWYNTFSHGPNVFLGNEGVEDRVNQLVEHIFREYGPFGTDEVWVAPAEHVVSYALLREEASIEIVSLSRNGDPVDDIEAARLAPDDLGGLESIVELPTRVRPVDTPIPILPLPTIEPQIIEVAPEATVDPSTEAMTDTVDAADTEVAMVTEATEGEIDEQAAAAETGSPSLFESLGILAWLLLGIALLAVFIAILLTGLIVWRYLQISRRS